MKKIPTLFTRDPVTRIVTDEVTAGLADLFEQGLEPGGVHGKTRRPDRPGARRTSFMEPERKPSRSRAT